MIIEDEAAITTVLQEILHDKGYEVSKAYDGLTGVKMLKDHENVDLALVDLNIPGISGKGVIEFMRSNDKLKNVPVIITTGNVYNPGDFPPKGSYQAILEKPFDLMELVKKVGEFIKKNKADDKNIDDKNIPI